MYSYAIEWVNSSIRGGFVPLCPITAAQASERALKASIRLVAYCASATPDSVELMYRDWCENQCFKEPDVVLGDEHGDLELELDDACDKDETDVREVLEHLGAETRLVGSEAEHELAETQEQNKDPALRTFELRNLPDASILEDLFSEPADDFSGTASDPRTLHHALSATDFNSEVKVFDRLWRFTMYMRYWHGGGDAHWISNPRATRAKSKKLNWYQCFGATSLPSLCPQLPLVDCIFVKL